MDDLEATRLCAEAMGITGWLTEDDPMVTNAEGEFITPYDPLHDDAQAMALVKRFCLSMAAPNEEIQEWCAYNVNDDDTQTFDAELNRAIVYCVAAMQQARPTSAPTS